MHTYTQTEYIKYYAELGWTYINTNEDRFQSRTGALVFPAKKVTKQQHKNDSIAETCKIRMKKYAFMVVFVGGGF